MKHFQFTIRQLILIYGALKVVHQHVKMSDEDIEEIEALIEHLAQLLQQYKKDESDDNYLEEICEENTKKYGPS